jgi:flagellar protein FliO/FliZ
MFDTLFGEGQYALKALFAFIVVFGLLALALWLARRFSGERLANATTRGRQPRLAVIDAATVDGRRRLILIRRDNVEHLLMVGGPTDVVIEPNIVRAAGAPREMAAARPLPASDPLPRAVPLGEGSMWPLQPEPAPRSEPLPRPEPAPRPQRPPPPPMVEESTTQWTAPEPELPAPPPLPPRERRPRNDPLSGLAEELRRVSPPPAPAHFEPPPRQAPRRELRARPQPPSPSAPASAPAADAKFTSPADQNLAGMAQRLEAALRRPNRTDDVQPPQSAPNAEPSGEETDELTPPPASSPGSRAAPPADTPTPARNDGRPARSDAKPVPQKSLYDSLEQEMASLLGRPGSKN